MNDQIYQLDVRLVSGRMAAGDLLRHHISKNSWSTWPIAAVRQRSPDIADEFEVDVEDELREEFDIWELYLPPFNDPFWQIAAVDA